MHLAAAPPALPQLQTGARGRSTNGKTRGMWTTDRLRYEPLGHTHADALVDALTDPLVGEYIGGPDVTTVAALHTRIDRLAQGPAAPDERWWNFVALRSLDGVLVGRLEATLYGDWAEIAYVFAPRHWGNGYATEGTRWLIGHLAAEGITELWAAVLPQNTRSIDLLLRVGFERRERPARPLASFDDGDVVFSLGAGTAG